MIEFGNTNPFFPNIKQIKPQNIGFSPALFLWTCLMIMLKEPHVSGNDRSDTTNPLHEVLNHNAMKKLELRGHLLFLQITRFGLHKMALDGFISNFFAHLRKFGISH